MTKKKKKHHIRFRSFLFILLFFYLLFSFGKYLYELPVKNIYIIGTNILSDQEIIDIAKLKDYPSLHKYSSKKIASNIKKIELVNSVKVKKDIFGKVTIKIDEAKPLFYYRSDDVIYLSNKKSIENNNKYVGIPILVNYVPHKILNDLVNNFIILKDGIIGEINEIEYDPDEKNGVVLDENRFLIRMNDTNIVYIDTINIEKLNNYQKIVAALEDNIHGYIYLNSNRTNASFKAFEEVKEEEEKKEEETHED